MALFVEWNIRIWADIETNMTSVERGLEYTRVDNEIKFGKVVDGWPSEGSLRFEDVELRYDGCRSSVLKKISFDVKPKEKVGIIGRTGAGKSSIISVLYRLYEFDGKIEIDHIDTKTVSLEFLR